MQDALGERLGTVEVCLRRSGHGANVTEFTIRLPGAWNNWGVRRKELAERLERIDRSIEDSNLYIRESGLRFERFMQRIDRRMERLEEESRESRAQLRANTDAIWKLLDRWGEGPPPDPA